MVTEAKRLMNDLPVLLASWMEEESVTKKIDKMGTAKYMRTYEIPEEEAQQLGSPAGGCRPGAPGTGLSFQPDVYR